MVSVLRSSVAVRVTLPGVPENMMGEYDAQVSSCDEQAATGQSVPCSRDSRACQGDGLQRTAQPTTWIPHSRLDAE